MPAERILFLTGHLAEPRLTRVLKGLGATEFEWQVLDIGVKVAALMTEAIIRRRLPRPVPADRVIVPGRCRADLEKLSADFGVPFMRGPDEISDLPAFLGRGGVAARPVADRHPHLRRDRRGVAARASTLSSPRRSAESGRRRRDRPRLPARHAFPASRRLSPRAEGGGLSGQRRFRRCRRADARQRAPARIFC